MEKPQGTYHKPSKPGKTTAFFICVLIALFLWFVRSLNTTYIRDIQVPVSFRNLPQNKKPLQAIPEHLNVEIKASGLKLFFILLNQPFQKLDVDFNDLKQVNKNYVITPSGVNLKKSLKFEASVRHISPDTLYLAETSGFQKNVPVKAAVSVSCAPGYSYYPPSVQPAFISIVGDSASLRRIDTIYTQALHLNDLDQSIDKNLALLKPADHIYLSTPRASVNIVVEKLLEHRLNLPVNLINTPPFARSVHVYPSRVEIKFTALQNGFLPEDTLHFKAAVNCSVLHQGKSPVFMSTVPGNVNLLSIMPSEVELLILKK